ncbi:hypothetical protein LTS18_007044, partial [Coniosporium uncinatum]
MAQPTLRIDSLNSTIPPPRPTPPPLSAPTVSLTNLNGILLQTWTPEPEPKSEAHASCPSNCSSISPSVSSSTRSSSSTTSTAPRSSTSTRTKSSQRTTTRTYLDAKQRAEQGDKTKLKGTRCPNTGSPALLCPACVVKVACTKAWKALGKGRKEAVRLRRGVGRKVGEVVRRGVEGGKMRFG